MPDSPPPHEMDEWVVWNGSAGILTMAKLGPVEAGADGRRAWLAAPFDMVGPFSLDELETTGRIAFAACIVMSRQRWQDDQVELRREAFEQRRAQRERMEREYNERFGGFDGFGDDDWGRGGGHFDESGHREALNLPADEELDASKIKTAFRKLAQKLHPDMGGSHEAFVRITEARDALMERFA
ncbi:J domain-containing protein [Derxia gummosa]|uniref:J domain-containing protein n=1 Tax=Derxia gummosa DSM 723 TaxID=1121388 RepID=A0A8B6X4A8_9BURK|nr:J domain-containing protein [Derxia gummosa]